MSGIISRSLWLSAFLVAGCSSPIQDYRGKTPALNLDEFFNGELVAHGIVQNYRGKVIRQFNAEISAAWEGENGLLDEKFFFDDGEQQNRCWRLKKMGNQYTGTAQDVVGTAKGVTEGNALNWRYTLEVPVKGKVRHIKFDDWLYLVDKNNLINRAKMSKFGFNVGEITLYIRKISNEPKYPFTTGCTIQL